MQIDINKEILETIFKYSTTAEQLTEYIHSTLVVDAVSMSVRRISRIVARALGKPYDPKSAEESTPDDKVEAVFNLEPAIQVLRQRVAKTDALAKATESLFERVVWVEIDGDSRRFEHLAHLIGATSNAAREAMEFGDLIAVKISTRRLGGGNGAS